MSEQAVLAIETGKEGWQDEELGQPYGQIDTALVVGQQAV